MDFSSMSGWDFERYCADCLLKKGFTKAEVTSGSGDHGVDIIAEQNGIRFGIQCKLYQGQIPNKAVQEAYTGASYYDCDVAVIMSNSELTRQAQVEAKKLRVKFWNIADYIPETDRKASQKGKISPSNTEVSYENFLTESKNQLTILQNKISKDVAKRSDWWISGRANQWLLYSAKLTESIKWYTRVKAIDAFLSDIQNSTDSYEGGKLLFKKLCFVSAVADSGKDITSKFFTESYEIYVQAVCESLNYSLPDSCGDAKNVAYKKLLWELIYSFEMFQLAIEQVNRIIVCFSDAELVRTMNTNSNIWDYQAVACELDKSCVQKLLFYFESMINLERKILKKLERISRIYIWKVKELQSKSLIHQSYQNNCTRRYDLAKSQYNNLLKRVYKANQGSSNILDWSLNKGVSATLANGVVDFEMWFNNKHDPVAIILANNQSAKNWLICNYYLLRNQSEKEEEIFVRRCQEKMKEELKKPEKELKFYQEQETIFGKQSSKRLGITDEISTRTKQIKSIQNIYQKGIKNAKISMQKRLDILYEETLACAEHNGVKSEVEQEISK
ncbi:MAG: restriction endonuclease [Roseburia intestinalis]|nr:restriction endonuclease [Roseburia intestinalis]